MIIPLSVGCRKSGSFFGAISKKDIGAASSARYGCGLLFSKMHGENEVSPEIVLELPSEEEIAVIEEKEVVKDRRFIRRTIRYRNGITVLLWLDSENRITRFEMSCEILPLYFVGNQIVKI